MARIRSTALANPAHIELLASPARIEIVDTLEALGEAASVAELAAALGRPADGLYYHLRQLCAAGLVSEIEAPDGNRYRTHANERVRLRYRPGATANADAVRRVAASILRVAGRDFDRAIADRRSVAEGAQRELWAARGKGWVGATELAEINRLLARLDELLRRPRSRTRDRLVALAWVLAPIGDKPARRGHARTKPRAAPDA